MKPLFIGSMLAIQLLWLTAGCEEDYPVKREYPEVRTARVTNITATGARFYGDIINTDGIFISDHGFVWGSSEYLTIEYSDKVAMGTTSGMGEYSSGVSYAFAKKQKYYVRAYIIAGSLTYYGESVIFSWE